MNKAEISFKVDKKFKGMESSYFNKRWNSSNPFEVLRNEIYTQIILNKIINLLKNISHESIFFKC